MFEDLVLKSKRLVNDKPPLILPKNQFYLASAMKGRERLSSKEITSILGWTSNKVSVLINVMCNKNIIKKNKVANRTTKAYLFSLSVKNFKMKGAE